MIVREHLQGALSFMLLLMVFAHSGAAAQDTGGHDTPSDGPRRISEVVFDISDYPGETGQIISLARDLTDLHPGGIFTDEILDKAVSVLKFSGRFESVEVEAVPGPDGVGVILRLKPYLVIREIDIRGQHPLFRRDIVRAMTAYVGDYLVPGLPQEQARLIREYILTEGFIDPRVSIRVIQSDEDASVKLEVEIDKGAYYALDSLRIRGNRNFTDAWIKTRLGIWWDSLYPGTAGRFQESRLEEDVRGAVEVALGHRLHEVGDVHAHGAAGDALGIAAAQASLGLKPGGLGGQPEIDLLEVVGSFLRFLLGHGLPRDFHAVGGIHCSTANLQICPGSACSRK